MISPTVSPIQAEDAQIKTRSELGPLLLICACYLVVGTKFFVFINRYSVNLFFWDHWDFENGPLFEHHTLWEIFRWQHGPHRQGFGGLLSALIDPLFHWSSRAQSFEAGILVLLASFCALWLKRRLWGRIDYFDAAIPLLFLVRNQAEAFTAGANIAHGPMPLLLVVLYCLAWTVRDTKWRYTLVVVLNFLLIYTGFGIFMGIVTPLLLTIQLIRNANDDSSPRIYPMLALIGAVASLLSFSIGYRFDPAVTCLSDNPHTPLPYLWFVALMFANFAGVKDSGVFPTLFSGLLGLMFIGSFAFAVERLIHQRVQSLRYLVVAALSLYALLFCFNTAIGRICLGITAGQQPRYMPYMITAFLALYFTLASLRSSLARHLTLLGFLALAAWCSLHLDTWTWLSARNRTHDQRAWRECYLKRESVEECDTITGSKIYPWPEATHLQEKLQFLKQNHLNLYSDQK
jgi:hypothetical protein